MTLIVEVPSDVEEKFRQVAARRGLTPIELAKTLVEREALAGADTIETDRAGMTPEERATAFLEWASGHRTDIPVVPMEAMSRDNLYEDRGL